MSDETLYTVCWRTPLNSPNFAQGSFTTTERVLGRVIGATLRMGHVITDIYIAD